MLARASVEPTALRTGALLALGEVQSAVRLARLACDPCVHRSEAEAERKCVLGGGCAVSCELPLCIEQLDVRRKRGLDQGRRTELRCTDALVTIGIEQQQRGLALLARCRHP